MYKTFCLYFIGSEYIHCCEPYKMYYLKMVNYVMYSFCEFYSHNLSKIVLAENSTNFTTNYLSLKVRFRYKYKSLIL